ncbi:iron-sulfur cluster co-chaperone protein HscB [Drosophila innubila]|uniref:iron-sulfur cluster co-chaperone protein HscB n=1 Tax=Drosophila innubila TaxID=198719 RepID=UPI00148E425F|nr:iron-sulfur cluster co-chaperone protein HscB [Drosophila innubila]
MRSVVAVLKTGFSGLQCPPTIRRNIGYYSYQQVRYVSLSSNIVCWNCQKPGKQMICEDCGSLQDVDDKINYFDLLEFPKTFAVHSQELTQRFRQLQTHVHPDKYSNKTSREQTNSADWSSLINKAYKTLSAPVERGQYMLQLEGEEMPKDNSALNTTFLIAMMERNEEVEEAEDSAALEQLNTVIAKELETNALQLSTHFQANDLAAVKATLVEMKYLHSIQSSIKRKQQLLMSL